MRQVFFPFILLIFLLYDVNMIQVIKTFSMREGRWYIGIKGNGDVKSREQGL